MISFPPEINVCKRYRIKSLQPFHSEDSPLSSFLEHTNYFWLAISEKIHRKHLSAGLQRILLSLKGPWAPQIVTLNWGNWWKETEETKRQKIMQEIHAVVSKEQDMNKAIVVQWGISASPLRGQLDQTTDGLVGPTLSPGKEMTPGDFCSISKHPKEKNVTGRSWFVFVGEQCWHSCSSETLGASFKHLRALSNMKNLVESRNQKQEEKSFTFERHKNQQR